MVAQNCTITIIGCNGNGTKHNYNCASLDEYRHIACKRTISRISPSSTFSAIKSTSNQWRSNRGFSRFKEPGPPTVRGPDRGHNLFYLEDAENQDSEETEIRSLAFSKTFLFCNILSGLIYI